MVKLPVSLLLHFPTMEVSEFFLCRPAAASCVHAHTQLPNHVGPIIQAELSKFKVAFSLLWMLKRRPLLFECHFAENFTES